jgi:3-deoxy-D-manno-octulosonate 8-phosphate phosphatase (KDO 8-P phosphatase)
MGLRPEPAPSPLDPTLVAAASAIEVVALDVDGVLTEDGFWWGPDGEEWKRFAFTDVMGISRATKAGFHFALVSGEASPLVDRFAAKMSVRDVFKGCKDKAAAVQELAIRREVPLSAICFVGNDVNDLGAMALVGLSAAPCDAHPSVLARVEWTVPARGGHGAVRAVTDLLMSVRAQRGAP